MTYKFEGDWVSELATKCLTILNAAEVETEAVEKQIFKAVEKKTFKVDERYTFSQRSLDSITNDEWLQLKSLSLSDGFLEFLTNWKLGLNNAEDKAEDTVLKMFDWHNPIIAFAMKNNSIVGWAVSVRDLNLTDLSWVGNVFVSPKDRNQGVGSQLVVRVIKPTVEIKTLFDKKVILPPSLLEEFKINYDDTDLYSAFYPSNNV